MEAGLVIRNVIREKANRGKVEGNGGGGTRKKGKVATCCVVLSLRLWKGDGGL